MKVPFIYFCGFFVLMKGNDFKKALEGALQFFPGIEVNRDQELSPESQL